MSQAQFLVPDDIDGLLLEERPDRPIEVEIGCGNGHFLVEYGEQQAQKLLIGVEIKRRRCEKSIKKVNNRHLSNVHIVRGRAEETLYRFPNGRINAFHIYFPDPWPKNRHRSRRLFRMPNLKALCEKLTTGGVIYFATDFQDYFIQAKLLMLMHPQLSLKDSLPPDELNLTLFNQRLTDAGRSIFFTSAVKLSGTIRE